MKFHPSVVLVGNQQSLWGQPFYATVTYRVEFADGTLDSRVLAGSYGRLPIHPMAMEYLDFPFEKLWSALKRERGYLSKLKSLAVTEGNVTLVTAGNALR